MSKAQCDSFIELVEKFNLLLICDDVYNFLWYNQPFKRLLSYKPLSVNVISNGSFSKILAPGKMVTLKEKWKDGNMFVTSYVKILL